MGLNKQTKKSIQKKKSTRNRYRQRDSLSLTLRNPVKMLNWKPQYMCKIPVM